MISALTDYGNTFSELVENLDVLSRHPFESEMEYRDDSGEEAFDPDTLITNSKSEPLFTSTSPLLHEYYELEGVEQIEEELDSLFEHFGSAPDMALVNKLVDAGKIKTLVDAQRFLLSWILKNHKEAALELAKHDINKDSRVSNGARFPADEEVKHAIILVPAKQMSEVPAFIHWDGANEIGSAALCQLVQHWQNTYQAQLVAAEGNVIEFHLPQPVKSVKDAFELAVIHDVLASGMLGTQAVSVWQYALTLLRSKNWTLWFAH